MLYPLSYGGVPCPHCGDRARGPIVALGPDTLSRQPRWARTLPYPAYPCRWITTSQPHPWSASSLPKTAVVDEKGHLHMGGIDLLELVEEFGTPLFVYDEDHLAHRLPRGPRRLGRRRRLRHQGLLVPGHGASRPRGRTAARRRVRAASSLWPCRPAFRPSASSSTATTSRPKSSPPRSSKELVASSSTPSTRSPASVACWSRPRRRAERPQVLVRVTPGVEAHTHEFVRTGQEDSKFGFSVSSGAAAEAVAALELMPGVELVGVHAHIGSQVFDASSFEQAAEVLGAFFAPFGPARTGGGWRSRACPMSTARPRPSQLEWADVTRAACAEAGVDPATRISAEPGPLDRRHRRHDALHRRHGQASPGHPHVRERRRRA